MAATSPRLRRPIALLLCAALLGDGLLVGMAHHHGLLGHGHAAGDCHASFIHQTEQPAVWGHEHGACSHAHSRPDLSLDDDSHEPNSHDSDEPHRHDDCAACRYLALASLSVFPLTLPWVDEVHSSSPLPAAATPVTRPHSLHQARAPPVI